MARKTNKTAHVLNLLSGSAGHKSNSAGDAAESPEKTVPAEKDVRSENPASSEKSAVSVPGIQMDDRAVEDPVSDIIHRQLLSEFEDAMSREKTSTAHVSQTTDITPADMTPIPAADITPTPAADMTPAPDMTPIPAADITPAPAANMTPTPTADITPAPAADTTPIPAADITPAPDTTPIPAANITPAPDTTPARAADMTPAPEKTPAAMSVTEEAPAAPEPDFILLNVMEEIVRHKIIYFMRQFEVCTCDRCVADTIALTLNGLQPKYIVTPQAAAAPLVSFYTNKYISDITVEATKACITIKENPRH